ncbi:hypothetical protein H0266_07405 [Halobacillus locisalis]|uniref:Uncharacterized protein n=1 Tax=Halobacillus locisalis TaxID=220753 RepID=A0A838CSY1_9BACI|nr:hypothetical protein [Halobacillus locisalis]MBA2174716.1 hypothetical protein [Halobacillus locisalis]
MEMPKRKMWLIIISTALGFSLFFHYQSFHEQREEKREVGRFMEWTTSKSLSDVGIMNANVWEDLIESDDGDVQFAIRTGMIQNDAGRWERMEHTDEIVNLLHDLNEDLYQFKTGMETEEDVTDLKEEINQKVQALTGIFTYLQETIPEEDSIAWYDTLDDLSDRDSELSERVEEQYETVYPN